MILNPKEMIDKGYIRAIDPGMPLDIDTQLSSNGIDLRLNTASMMRGHALIGIEKRQLVDYRRVSTSTGGFYHFESQKAYAIETYEYCEVPPEAIALVIHRSTLNRCGCFITGSVYDAGYNGFIGATLRPSVSMSIERGVRIAQIIFMKADSYKIYEGIYKGEMSHNTSKQKVDKE